jgi:hypothetical protein
LRACMHACDGVMMWNDYSFQSETVAYFQVFFLTIYYLLNHPKHIERN